MVARAMARSRKQLDFIDYALNVQGAKADCRCVLGNERSAASLTPTWQPGEPQSIC